MSRLKTEIVSRNFFFRDTWLAAHDFKISSSIYLSRYLSLLFESKIIQVCVLEK